MTAREYADQVVGGLRRLTEKEREAVREELLGHMEDHMEAMLDMGWEEPLAQERAVAAMGDPEEVARGIEDQYSDAWLVIGDLALFLAGFLVLLLLLMHMVDGQPGFLEDLRYRFADQPPAIRCLETVEAESELDLSLEAGNSRIRAYRISVGEVGGEQWAVVDLVGYNRRLFGVAGRPWSKVALESENGTPGGVWDVQGHEWTQRICLFVPLGPEDTQIALVCGGQSHRLGLPEEGML